MSSNNSNNIGGDVHAKGRRTKNIISNHHHHAHYHQGPNIPSLPPLPSSLQLPPMGNLLQPVVPAPTSIQAQPAFGLAGPYPYGAVAGQQFGHRSTTDFQPHQCAPRRPFESPRPFYRHHPYNIQRRAVKNVAQRPRIDQMITEEQLYGDDSKAMTKLERDDRKMILDLKNEMKTLKRDMAKYKKENKFLKAAAQKAKAKKKRLKKRRKERKKARKEAAEQAAAEQAAAEEESEQKEVKTETKNRGS